MAWDTIKGAPYVQRFSAAITMFILCWDVFCDEGETNCRFSLKKLFLKTRAFWETETLKKRVQLNNLYDSEWEKNCF